MNCDLCGVEILPLAGPDFNYGVCLSPVHEKPRFVHYPWMGKVTYETRDLLPHERQEIDRRKDALMKRLPFVQNDWELLGVVRCFFSGGWITEVDERIVGKGKHL